MGAITTYDQNKAKLKEKEPYMKHTSFRFLFHLENIFSVLLWNLNCYNKRALIINIV